MTNWVDSKTPTIQKWMIVAMGSGAGVCLASAPFFVGFKIMHGWPLWTLAAGILIVLVSTWILQSSVCLTVLVLASFAFCVNVSGGHLVSWAFAWAANWIGARFAHSFLVDMSWLYHWSKVNGNSNSAGTVQD